MTLRSDRDTMQKRLQNVEEEDGKNREKKFGVGEPVVFETPRRGVARADPVSTLLSES